MRKLKFFSVITTIFVVVVLIFSAGCKKENIIRPPGSSDYAVFMSSDGGNTRQAVADGQVVILPDSGLTLLIWTDPSTPVTWTMTGPVNQTWSGVDQISPTFPYSGTYNINVVSLGVNWNITIIVSPGGMLSYVGTRFVGSQYVGGGMFEYTFRINKPIYISPGDTLFRITELANDPLAPYLPFFTGVQIVSTVVPDSIDLTFSYPASGNLPISVKFIAGRMQNGNPVWFNADPNDPYKCQDAPPALTDILQANLKNGQALPPGGTFPVPPGSPSMGDYNEPLPVLLLSVSASTNTLNIWFYTLEQNPTFRYKEDILDNWTEISPTSFGGGYYQTQLSLSPSTGLYILDWGSGSGISFTQCQFVALSTKYYAPHSAITLYM